MPPSRVKSRVKARARAWIRIKAGFTAQVRARAKTSIKFRARVWVILVRNFPLRGLSHRPIFQKLLFRAYIWNYLNFLRVQRLKRLKLKWSHYFLNKWTDSSLSNGHVVIDFKQRLATDFRDQLRQNTPRIQFSSPKLWELCKSTFHPNGACANLASSFSAEMFFFSLLLLTVYQRF